MGKDQCRHAAYIAITFAILCFSYSSLALSADSVHSSSCDRTTKHSVLSPGGDWEASAIQEVCDLGITSAVSALVQITNTANPKLRQIVLGMDLPARASDFPQVVWSSPAKVIITVAAGSTVGIRVAEFQGVQVEILYCPDDPALQKDLLTWRIAYQQWLRDSTSWIEKKKDPRLSESRPAMPQPPANTSFSACKRSK